VSGPIPRRSKLDLARLESGARRLFPLFREIGLARWQGRTAVSIDRLVERYLQKHGLSSVMRGYRGYPACSAVSVNSIAAHGVPDDRLIQRGDLFTLDVAARGGGWVADTAWTYLMPGSSEKTVRFFHRSWSAFRTLLTRIEPEMTLFELARISQQISDAADLVVLPEFVGHGIGKELHEPPVIPFTIQAADSGSAAIVLEAGSTVNIEPIYTSGTGAVRPEDDGWGYRTVDGTVTAHFELTLLIGTARVEVLQFGRCEPRELPLDPPFGLLSG
jgi:methionyl aminopeptidase